MLKKLTIVAALGVMAGTAVSPVSARDRHYDHRHHPVCHMDRHHHRICR